MTRTNAVGLHTAMQRAQRMVQLYFDGPKIIAAIAQSPSGLGNRDLSLQGTSFINSPFTCFHLNSALSQLTEGIATEDPFELSDFPREHTKPEASEITAIEFWERLTNPNITMTCTDKRQAFARASIKVETEPEMLVTNANEQVIITDSTTTTETPCFEISLLALHHAIPGSGKTLRYFSIKEIGGDFPVSLVKQINLKLSNALPEELVTFLSGAPRIEKTSFQLESSAIREKNINEERTIKSDNISQIDFSLYPLLALAPRIHVHSRRHERTWKMALLWEVELDFKKSKLKNALQLPAGRQREFI